MTKNGTTVFIDPELRNKLLGVAEAEDLVVDRGPMKGQLSLTKAVRFVTAAYLD
jgi:hypothetical protein